jgi:hypothetical protein
MALGASLVRATHGLESNRAGCKVNLNLQRAGQFFSARPPTIVLINRSIALWPDRLTTEPGRKSNQRRQPRRLRDFPTTTLGTSLVVCNIRHSMLTGRARLFFQIRAAALQPSCDDQPPVRMAPALCARSPKIIMALNKLCWYRTTASGVATGLPARTLHPQARPNQQGHEPTWARTCNAVACGSKSRDHRWQ